MWWKFLLGSFFFVARSGGFWWEVFFKWIEKVDFYLIRNFGISVLVSFPWLILNFAKILKKSSKEFFFNKILCKSAFNENPLTFLFFFNFPQKISWKRNEMIL
jgi:hypothetical protein